MKRPDEDFGSTIRLVAAAQKGDAQALEDLFARYLPRARQIAALRMGYRVRQLHDVEDIVQDALVRVLSGIERFEHQSEGSFRNWLGQCIENAVVDSARKGAAKKRGAGNVRRFGDFGASAPLSALFAGKGPTPSQVVQGAEMETRIEEALLQLPKHYRDVLVQRQLCEMSYAEIADSMGFTEEATARKACSRAIHKLREMLGD